MRAKVENDICVRITEPGHELENKFVFQPNSVRRDIELAYTLPTVPRVSDRPFSGRDIR